MNEVDRLIEFIKDNEYNINKLSTGEQIAVAFVFNRMDWLPNGYSHPLEALDRLGEKWLQKLLDHCRNN
jgi:hypothetical protein